MPFSIYIVALHQKLLDGLNHNPQSLNNGSMVIEVFNMEKASAKIQMNGAFLNIWSPWILAMSKTKS